MSNDFDTNPWILDGTGIIRTSAVKVLRMEYHPAATGNIITIEDKDGRVSWTRTCIFATELDGVRVMDTPMVFNGFEVAVITAGKLYVWTE
jgi:hypothetical protein